ncbi:MULTISPECIES: tripartite tricarboxylate transporter permease [unclassified Pseudoalteromonas]|uniref:tripartite tricarboxylate transporter permease n=1 Tax=unclassified Pseudoalteromonas TaxID=194690 RepID=UPI000C7E68D2|nr:MULTISPECIES: tripartite tricarboxylate transporter permease [unclassified Pseudoalteromonas]AUJ71655.1 Tripartite tricarboxylate transporter TctA family protein [Pseudoalteromonas sp. NC201]MCF2828386.1 tripartite tricarboxylate transporter permease [Pseudoalteromonas sp. OF5H-5]MCF2832789.1 tripartite tricarboxylate transporter permease [Pseudoalteromonas sp. DL2-H6]MCF2924474.1 tripartite tricarboxylate transporter permease [Pseudoalteromonas sp. DL2-H1]MCF7514662.1 tripartite tricarboxy
MLDGILVGLSTAFMWQNLLYVIVGCFVGTFIGMLPGLGPITAIALMIPITYNIGADSGMILMAGVYYGAIFGGSTSSILINAPGVAGTVASSFDGYPMAKQGHAGKALAVAAYASFTGGTIGALMLMIAAPLLAKVSLSFQSPDYVMLMFLGLTAIAAFSAKGQFLKAMMMTVFGLILSTVGIDPSSGTERFTFGQADLLDGVSFLLVAMATFALSEALINVIRPEKANQGSNDDDTPVIGSTKLSGAEVKEMAPVVGRSSILGFIIGVLPGAGATIASFMAYATERNLAPKAIRERFGRGEIRGLAAPESANNAACTGSFVPLLTLGIPGSGTTAIMLGALIAYGIQPGPTLMQDNPTVFWSVIVSMYFGNIVLLILNLPLIPYFAKALTLPRSVLTVMILFFSLIGVYLVSFNTFDLFMMVGFALVAVVLRLLSFPMAPLLLGFILGDMIERNYRRAMMISDGSISFIWERPLTLGIFALAMLVLLIPLKEYFQQRKVAQ